MSDAPAQGWDKPWYQFSLRSMLILITVVAVLLAVGQVFLPALGFFLAMVTLLLVPGFVAGIVYGRGSERAFSIGGATSTLIFAYVYFSMRFTSGFLGILWWPFIWVWIVLSGLLSVKVRSTLMRRHKRFDGSPEGIPRPSPPRSRGGESR